LIDFRKKFPEYYDLDTLTLAQKLASKLPEYQDTYRTIKEISERTDKQVSELVTSKVITDSDGHKDIVTPSMARTELERRDVVRFRKRLRTLLKTALFLEQ